ncbi:hypothetical protein Tco_0230584, partial [Tanacetum coccineum]
SDAETEIDDNTIPYHQYLLDNEAQNVPTEVSADTSDKCIDTSSASNAIFEITKLRQQLQGKDDTIRNLDALILIVGSLDHSLD